MTDLTQYDTIITIDNSCNEAKKSGLAVPGALDPRLRVGSILPSQEFHGFFTNAGAGSSMSFGNVLRSQLQMGQGYATEVVDFGDAVSVKITYMNTKTAKSASQSFIILFSQQGRCNVKSSSARWRTCNDVGQAASYIRSRCSVLQSRTTSIN